MAAQDFATAAQVVVESTKQAGFFARHFDKAVAVAKSHPAAAVAVGVVGAAALGWGGYKGAKAIFGSKAKAAPAKPAEAKPEAKPEDAAEAPKEEAAK